MVPTHSRRVIISENASFHCRIHPNCAVSVSVVSEQPQLPVTRALGTTSSTNPVLLVQRIRERQKAEMDSNSPSGVRKRRRPAYSCIECRRRKVRCDRAKPCGQCTAHNTPSCTYAERHPRASQHADLPQEVNERWHRTPERAAPPDDALACISAAPSRIRGALNKTRVFGHGHWMNSMSMVR